MRIELNKNTDRLAVSPGEAALMTGIGRTKLYELINQKEIPSFTLGRRRLIRVEDLRAWLDRMSEL
jgi:excisionase family DNA binding protein